ncbi:MAG: transcription antitermination factor NusB [Myxococcota bacterium]
MSVRRKGRELALLLLFALDNVLDADRQEAQKRFWTLFDQDGMWDAFMAEDPEDLHPLRAPLLCEIFDRHPVITASRPLPSPKLRQIVDFAQERVDGFWGNKAQVDRRITEASEGWRIQRITQVDRNILRLGTYELVFCPDIPGPVAINEALELGKRYSSISSRSFLNGVLDRIFQAKEGKRHKPYKKKPEQDAPLVLRLPSRKP